MASQDKGRPLPKFGEWDVSNPASAEGFTVIFNKARDEKKTSANPRGATSTMGNNAGSYSLGGHHHESGYQYPRKSSKWFCCG